MQRCKKNPFSLLERHLFNSQYWAMLGASKILFWIEWIWRGQSLEVEEKYGKDRWDHIISCICSPCALIPLIKERGSLIKVLKMIHGHIWCIPFDKVNIGINNEIMTYVRHGWYLKWWEMFVLVILMFNKERRLGESKF